MKPESLQLVLENFKEVADEDEKNEANQLLQMLQYKEFLQYGDITRIQDRTYALLNGAVHPDRLDE